MTVTRFAPSPTGLLHVGNLRTALFNWLIARKAGGTFILRIDDTDDERSREEYVDQIRRDLEWLGLEWDREERQSRRLDRYETAADTLRIINRLYDCYETSVELDLRRKKQLNMGRPPVYDRAALALTEEQKAALASERTPHWRFLLDQTRITWEDMILGPQSIDSASLSDPVLIRGDGRFLYTLCSVVDDLEMGVTDVVRGADHVTNTATQTQIIAALGGRAPRFGHHSLLTGPGGASLSKRLGVLSLKEMREQGVEPMALLSHLARIGSSAPVEPRVSLGEIIEGFDIGQFGAAPTSFDPADLFAMTEKVLKITPYGEIAGRLGESVGVSGESEGLLGESFWLAVRENLATLADAREWWEICQGRATPLIEPEDAAFVREALALLPPQPWDGGSWKAWTDAVKAATGRKGRALFQPLRKALTGRDSGPDMSALMPLFPDGYMKEFA
jgi:glutamyl-tRNA synthetase